MKERRIFRDKGRESALEAEVTQEIKDRNRQIYAAAKILIAAECPDPYTLQWAKDFVSMTPPMERPAGLCEMGEQA